MRILICSLHDTPEPQVVKLRRQLIKSFNRPFREGGYQSVTV